MPHVMDSETGRCSCYNVGLDLAGGCGWLRSTIHLLMNSKKGITFIIVAIVAAAGKGAR